jgi:hypothetical protein
MKHIIFGNYGNETIALIQWAHEHELANVSVVHTHTGWAAEHWHSRIAEGVALAERYQFKTVELTSKKTFEELIMLRKSFPSQKFQWCAGFLKGLSFLEWLDSVDPACEALIILGHRRVQSLKQQNLLEFIEASEHYGERRVWYPLFNHSDENRDALISKTFLKTLSHRSLECDPCANNTTMDFLSLSDNDAEKTSLLEKKINKNMFELNEVSFGIKEIIQQMKNENKYGTLNKNQYPVGCGTPFACGL